MRLILSLSLAGLLLQGCNLSAAGGGVGKATTASPSSTSQNSAPAAAPSAAPAPPSATPVAEQTPHPLAEQTPRPVAEPIPGPVADSPAEEIIMEDVGIQYTLPAGWTRDANGNVEDGSKTLGVFFITPAETDVPAVLERIGANLEQKLKDVKVEEELNEHEINGIKAICVEGTASLPSGQPIEWAVELMAAKKPLIMLEMAEAGAFDKNKASFEAFEDSFHPLEEAAEDSSTEE